MLNATTIHSIRKELEASGIIIDIQSLQLHAYQGFMSTVYEVASNIGILMIHTRKWTNPELYQSFQALKILLKNNIEIPTGNLLLIQLIEDSIVTVQEKCDGLPAWVRQLCSWEIIDSIFVQDRSIYFENLLRTISIIHKLNLDSGGKLFLWNDWNPKWTQDSWKNFLEISVPKWLEVSNLFPEKEIFFDILSTISYPERNSLIHGDCINPSNVLVKDINVTGIIDWEHALLWDPAWEFASYGWKPIIDSMSLNTYFKAVQMDSIEYTSFLIRIEQYRILWLLWAVSVHSVRNPKNEIFTILSDLLREEIKTYSQKNGDTITTYIPLRSNQSPVKLR